MPIQSDDIKLLKSAVMADVPEGGGGMTGIEVVDGLSNDIFPDISTDARASGKFELRKLFGVALTDDTDTLLGAGFSVMQPPEDPLVSILLFETPGWFDERTAAISLVERYLVKGPRLIARVADVHYAGTSLLQLYNIAPSGFPNPGDAIVLRNNDGSEQYVRVREVALGSAEVQTDDGGAWTVFTCNCTLNKPLAMDLLGAPIAKIQPSTAARVFTTSPAQGARFHGVRPLAEAALIGARSVYVSGGILVNLVPSSAVPEPVIDQYPLIRRPTLSRTAQSTLTTPAQVLTLGPGTTLYLPTSVEPGTLTMQHGATAFTSNASGDLLQGSVVVGSVDASGRSIVMLGTAPAYGSGSNSITYKPATRTGATAYSLGVEVTDANQSLAWVRSLEPTPALGTLGVAYMAQGRWYELLDDGTGKLSGGDSSYGVGTYNPLTGSVASTFGALPDVGSLVIYTWGEADSAVAASGMPARAWAWLPVPELPAPGSLVIAWPRGATNYSASVAANGVVTGPAQVLPPERQEDGTYLIPWSPDTLPDGPVTITFTSLSAVSGFTNDGGGAYTLTGAPIKPGSVRFNVIATINGAPKVVACYSQGTEVYAKGIGVIGSINNTTGAMVLSHGSLSVTTWKTVKVPTFAVSSMG